jgi:hypothetical protein
MANMVVKEQETPEPSILVVVVVVPGHLVLRILLAVQAVQA